MRTFNRLFTAVFILVVVLSLGACQPMVVPTVAPAPGPSPQVEANRKLAERFLEELWNEGNLEVADEILGEDFVSYAFPEGGREVLKGAVAGFHADLPDGSFATDEVIVTEDKIVIRGAAMAVPAGAPEGAEPERLDDWIATLSVEDGKITDRWIAFVPSPGPPPEVEANRILAERYMEELWNESNLEVADEILSEDFVSRAFPEGGREVLKEAVAGFHADIPGGSFVTDEVIVTEDKIVLRGSAMTVLEDAPEGAEPERLDRWIVTLSVEDGKITDRWIGFVPTPGPPAGEEPSAQTPAEANKAIVGRFLEEVFNQGNLDVIDELVAPDVVVHHPTSGELHGVADVEEWAADTLNTFDDFHLTYDLFATEGNMVTKHWGATGTYAETGEPVVIEHAVSTYRLADGKIVEITMSFNTYDLLQQMGIVP